MQEYCMLVVNFGEAPASFILGEGEHIVSMDKDISPEPLYNKGSMSMMVLRAA